MIGADANTQELSTPARVADFRLVAARARPENQPKRVAHLAAVDFYWTHKNADAPERGARMRRAAS